ncbi:tripartite tricarboxylate transporter TctB family protein [Anoxynatronum buryatiense]|uniref:Tripartite tricarboxylate transporter TctB family protein n=1 Tax=Anoxynatronum buryatiense TaxID=489973 RepID=A0AA45WTW1_9CLOT|nr:tripartite tricarboxylate transporter TctB family protein [Anoxynatronum buryatiense]SMP44045.1 Tripartite tricarboxylate transporter TctB family protein [Anoxynatronum buryatiense]
MKTLDQKLGWIMVILCGVFFYLTSGLSAEAALYPRFVLAIMVLLTLFFIVKAYRTPGESTKLFPKLEKKQFIAVLCGSILYVYLLQIIGYFSATFLYFAGIMWTLKVDKPRLFLVSIGFCLFIFILFQHLLGVRLPKGLIL